MKKEDIIDLIKTIVSSLIIVFIIYFFIAIPVNVNGSSMYPNLHDGDFGFSGKITLLFGIDRYDIVVIDSEKTSDKIVKRVIGLPNETLTFKGTTIYVDGEAIEDPYGYYEYFEDLGLPDGYTVTLGEDEYYVLGDNRNSSKDSRAYQDPAFKRDEFVSKDILVLFPFSNFGIH